MIPKRKRGPIPKIELPAYRDALRRLMEGPYTAREIGKAIGRSERAIISDMQTLMKDAEKAA